MVKIKNGMEKSVEMINLDEAKKYFNKYVKEYQNTPRVKLKAEHMLRVMEIALKLATELNLSEEDIKLAGVIGLLHDIGRFEQIKIYNTFIDKDSIDHANYSVEQLFKNNLIRKFIVDKKYDYIIMKAIANHNKFQIEDNLDEKTLLHCKIIRDADKCDIYEQVLQSNGNLVFDGKYDKNANIDSKVLNDFLNNKSIKNEDVKTVLDDYVRKQALIYGLYYKQSIKYIKENDYTGRLTIKFKETFNFCNKETYKQIHLVDEHIKDYINITKT